MPFLAGGAPNTAFENFYRFANQSIVMLGDRDKHDDPPESRGGDRLGLGLS